MTTVRRLRVVMVFMAAAVLLAFTQVWGDARDGDKGGILKGHSNPPPGAQQLMKELAADRISTSPVLSYRSIDGDTFFALQVQPKLEAVPARPRDLLIVVDTSASMAGQPLIGAKFITRAIVEACTENDRVNLWTANIVGPNSTHSLTGGFVAPAAEQIKKAFQGLEQEVGSGAVDLQNALEQAIRSVPVKAGRQPVLLFLGTGKSVVRPLSEADRLALGQQMAAKEIAFFPIPLGQGLEPNTLHGLASSTGGMAVRVQVGDQPSDTVAWVKLALATPILYPQKFQLSADVIEAFPTRLPPLRGDAPTLVVGRMKPAATLPYTITGTVAGKAITVTRTETVPAAQIDHFFLASLVKQWKKAEHPEGPALIRADRALVFAFEQHRLARDEFLAQGQWALARDHLEAADRLFEAAARLDPSDAEARAGRKLVEGLRSGKLNRKDLEANRDKGQGMRIQKHGKDGVKYTRGDLLALAQVEPGPKGLDKAPPRPPLAPDMEAADLLQQRRLQMQIEGQRVTATVNEALRQARRLLPIDPDAAHDLVKRTLAGLRGNEDLTPAVRAALLGQLEAALQNIGLQGVQIKLQRDEQLRLRIEAQRRLDVEQERLKDDERMKRRMMAFAELMNTGRLEEAWREAMVMQQDAIRSGRGVPVAVTAADRIGDIATNLREVQEVQRQAEQRYLLTMLQVDKSHVPSPDEPPLTFPPASYWRELSKLRKDKYDVYIPGGAIPQETIDLRNKLRKPLQKPIQFDANTPLKEALGFISDLFDITILIDEAAFKVTDPTADVTILPVRLQKMDRVSLATVLKLLLSQIPDGTYLIRKEYLEVTTGQRALLDSKATWAFPAADLVIPIPNSVNVTSLNQNIAIQQGQLSIGGGGLLGMQRFGGNLNLAGGAGLGGGLAGIGGLAGLGGIAGIAAGLGAQGQGGLLGGLGFQGAAQNLGFGGGFGGIGGGQLGQFGNLGGQFGMQGGDQSAFLLQLITTVIAPGEWKPIPGFNQPGGAAPPAGAIEPEAPILEPPLLNSLSYYPPARALAVRGSTKIALRIPNIARAANQPPAAPAPRDRPPGATVIKPGDKERAVANAAKPPIKWGKEPDPRTIWQEVLTSAVTQADPYRNRLIIACADTLALSGKFDHAAEFLKANLRQGIVVRPWVFEALALALQAGGGSPEEVERAQLSALDLQPDDASGYLKASQAMAESKRYDRALAFCRQAAALEPSLSDTYVDALGYAERGQDSDAMTWAAGNLLRQDWPVDNQDIHVKAQEKLTALAKVLEAARRKAEAERMQAAVRRVRERDLIITLTYQGDACLDLKVKEPVGTICSDRHRQTPGGGTLMGGDLAEMKRQTYVAAQAFSGDYEVTVEKVWGRPLGSKVTLEIIQHQGTPRETRDRQTVVLDRSHSIKLKVADGRRTTMADASTTDSASEKEPPEADGNRVLTRLRALSDAQYDALTMMNAGVLTNGRHVPGKSRTRAVPRHSGDMVYQTKLATSAANGMDLVARVVVRGDQSFVELVPVFQTVTNRRDAPVVTNPLIPGGK